MSLGRAERKHADRHANHFSEWAVDLRHHCIVPKCSAHCYELELATANTWSTTQIEIYRCCKCHELRAVEIDNRQLKRESQAR